eukprot:9651557-Prorocentrum_lima.AAC.1
MLQLHKAYERLHNRLRLVEATSAELACDFHKNAIRLVAKPRVSAKTFHQNLERLMPEIDTKE